MLRSTKIDPSFFPKLTGTRVPLPPWVSVRALVMCPGGALGATGADAADAGVDAADADADADAADADDAAADAAGTGAVAMLALDVICTWASRPYRSHWKPQGHSGDECLAVPVYILLCLWNEIR